MRTIQAVAGKVYFEQTVLTLLLGATERRLGVVKPQGRDVDRPSSSQLDYPPVVVVVLEAAATA
jgi:hypothetical protein